MDENQYGSDSKKKGSYMNANMVLQNVGVNNGCDKKQARAGFSLLWIPKMNHIFIVLCLPVQWARRKYIYSDCVYV